MSIHDYSPLMRLNFWKQEDEDDKWAQMVIDWVVDKLTRQKGSLEELTRALSQKDAQTNCVAIPKSLDGRLQVKGLPPHVVYCRVWRWPDLQNRHELKPMDHCKFAYSRDKNEVCINPYHYQRVEPPVLPHIMVPLIMVPPIMVPPIKVPLIMVPPIMVPPIMVPRNPQIVASWYKPVPSYLDTQKPDQELVLVGDEPMPTPVFSPSSSSDHSVNIGIPSPLPMTSVWCSIFYHELNHHIGEVFKATRNDVVIDGFTDPSTTGDRFCLGLLPSVCRNSTIENTRRHIGRGLHLVYRNGEVFAECLSDSAMFFQSRNCNTSNLFQPTTVCKIPSHCSIKIFNDQEFASILTQSVNLGYEAVYELTKMCTICLSFVEGWGAEYLCQNITSTPCWIEIVLHGPLISLDEVLVQMNPPSGKIDCDS